MTTQNLVNIGSGNGLLPDNTKQLPELWWLIISEVLLYFNYYQVFENYISENTAISPGANGFMSRFSVVV